MKICRRFIEIKTKNAFEILEKKYNMVFPEEVKNFFEENNAGVPQKMYISIDGDDYEVRSFLSFNEDDEYDIYKPLDFFQTKTKGKIVPFAIDSGDNYYCYNKENGCVYFYASSEDKYYKLSNKFTDFINLFV